MEKISRLLSRKDFDKHTSTSDIDEENDQINSIETNISQIENSLLDWTIPKLDVKTIYKIGTFDFMQGYSIKTTEQTISINKDNKNIQLLSSNAIKNHREKRYKFLHVGLVQVAIKPLFRLGIDAPVLLCLRDARHTDFNNSILAIVETNIANGPIYFNCYPNFTAGLFDPHIMDILTLTVKTKKLEFKENVKALAVIYRVYYKTMTTTIEPKTRLVSPKDETIIFEANTLHANVKTPKRLKWDEITRSGNWNLQDVNVPKPIEINDQVSNIIEHSDGSVDICFSTDLSRSARHSSSYNSSILGDNKYNKSHSMKLKGVDFNDAIPKPLYEEDNKSDTYTNESYNPTRSEIENYRDQL